jgi:hypothetical protein
MPVFRWETAKSEQKDCNSEFLKSPYIFFSFNQPYSVCIETLHCLKSRGLKMISAYIRHDRLALFILTETTAFSTFCMSVTTVARILEFTHKILED